MTDGTGLPLREGPAGPERRTRRWEISPIALLTPSLQNSNKEAHRRQQQHRQLPEHCTPDMRTKKRTLIFHFSLKPVSGEKSLERG
jgi:hypothetical protein